MPYLFLCNSFWHCFVVSPSVNCEAVNVFFFSDLNHSFSLWTSLSVFHSMLWSLLAVTVVSAAVLYVLCRWLIPAAVQSSGWLALLWHDVILERLLNIMTGSSRPQVTLTVIHTYITHICRDELLMFREDRESLMMKIPCSYHSVSHMVP